MEKERYLTEVTRQLRLIFGAIRDGHKPPEIIKHRCEGVMRAGVFLGIVSNAELAQLMEAIHLEVTGVTIAERKASSRERFRDEEIDYSQYESPAYERVNL